MASKWIVILSGTTTFFVRLDLNKNEEEMLIWICFQTLSNFIRSRKDPVDSIERKEILVKQPVSLVIGTGIIGLTSAYYLARSGHQVICIDKREDVALETRSNTLMKKIWTIQIDRLIFLVIKMVL